MNKVIILLTLFALTSCSSQLDKVKSELIGCWELTEIDGVEEPGFINYVKYSESKSYIYWGVETEQGLLVDSSEIRYSLKLDKSENVLLVACTEADSTVSKVSITENSKMKFTVLKSKKIWSYKRITEEKLKKFISSRIDRSQGYN